MVCGHIREHFFRYAERGKIEVHVKHTWKQFFRRHSGIYLPAEHRYEIYIIGSVRDLCPALQDIVRHARDSEVSVFVQRIFPCRQ